jgi:hypothetical protein
MKVSCPNCKKVVQAPDDWAGKKVKCPGCKQPISLPKATADRDDLGIDFNSLEALEQAGEAIVFERKGKPMTLKEAQAAAAAVAPKSEVVDKADPRIRTCPRCSQKVRADDIYGDLICRHCGAGIPGLEVDSNTTAKYTNTMADRIKSKVSFYTGFMGAAVYPLPAMPHILLGMGVALAAIAVPLLGVLAFTESSSLNTVNERNAQGPSSGWVGYFLTAMFILEGIYFGSVGYYVLIDSIRSTAAHNESPPGLTWNIINLGAALGGYVALIVFYAVVIIALVGGVPSSAEDLDTLSSPWRLGVLALLTFSVPMNIIGLASSHAMDGLHPLKVFKSIGQTIGHYIFLFLIVLVYLGIYVAVMWVAMGYAGPAIARSASQGLQAGFFSMLAGVGAWALVMGMGFYFAYSIGRLLGLFTRSYRESLDFEI